MVNFEDYMALRNMGYFAEYALRRLRIYEAFKALESVQLVRLKIEPDTSWLIADLEGDCFDPDVNTDTKPGKLVIEREAFHRRLEDEGVWGMVAEYSDGEQWHEVDSVWGFVGASWKHSGYDADLKQAAIDAYNAVEKCECCGRPKLKKD